MHREKAVVLGYCTWDSFKPTTIFEMMNIFSSGLIKGIVCSTGSLLPLTRNVLVRDVYNQYPNFTHLICIDADMGGISASLLNDLINKDKEIIGPLCTYRNPPYLPNIPEHHFQELIIEMAKEPGERKLISVTRVGFGCLVIKREVLDKTAEITILENGQKSALWFDLDRPPRPGFYEEVEGKIKEVVSGDFESIEQAIINSFKEGLSFGINAHIGGAYVGEDYNFCDRAKKCGFEIFVDPNFAINHIGDCQYNVQDWLDYLYAKQKGNVEILNRIENKTLALRIVENKKLITLDN
jgi:hypothetical protein